MAYSDYGGYAYLNGGRVTERSDAIICPDGTIFASPGMWPGFAALAAGGEEELKKQKAWPKGHVILGDGPIYVALYKQSSVTIFCGNTELDELSLLKDMPPEAIDTWEYEGKSERSLNVNYFREREKCCVFEVDGCRLDVFFTEEDNFYQYAKLTQPDGTVWYGFSGYGVGAGFDDSYKTDGREAILRAFWPESGI